MVGRPLKGSQGKPFCCSISAKSLLLLKEVWTNILEGSSDVTLTVFCSHLLHTAHAMVEHCFKHAVTCQHRYVAFAL